ncbi:MAG: sigma-70 family RNA polymerase sigma factor, partial [Paludibacter sp.]
MNSSVDDVDEHISTSELQQRIEKALTKLPPQCKRVFEMSRMEQLSYSEISKNLGISINTVENQVSKALKIFRIELKDFLSLCILAQII